MSTPKYIVALHFYRRHHNTYTWNEFHPPSLTLPGRDGQNCRNDLYQFGILSATWLKVNILV